MERIIFQFLSSYFPYLYFPKSDSLLLILVPYLYYCFPESGPIFSVAVL